MIGQNYFKKPIIAALLGFTLGLIIGLVGLGWGLWPVVWKDAAPVHLRQDFQVDYLRMTIDSYRTEQNDTLAIQRYMALGSGGPTALQTIENNPGNEDVNTIQDFKDLVQAEAMTSTPEPDNEGFTNNPAALKNILIIGGALILFALVGIGIFRYLVPIFRSTKASDQIIGNRENEIISPTELPNYEPLGEEPPISQFVTTYVLGDDLFDDSFSIDAPSGEFLGECGIGISEAIGVGEPKKVAAFEIWLFDKNDIQTITKVLMSTHSFNDVATHQRLQAKGEPFMADKGKQIVLETAALQLVATISDMEYGQGALPQDSYFERLTLEIAVWPKVVPPN